MPLFVLPTDPAESVEVVLDAWDFGPGSTVASVRLRIVWDDPWAPAPRPVGVEFVTEDAPGVVTVRLRADRETEATVAPGMLDPE